MMKKGVWIFALVTAAAIPAFWLYSQRQGYIKIDTPGFETDLNLHRSWWNKAATISADEPIKVCIGTYKPERAVLRLEKDEQTWWGLLCRRGPWGELSKINVAKGKTTILKLGPPLIVHTDVQRNNQVVSIGLSLVGQAGEHWSAQVLTRQGPLAAPKFRIVDETGNVLAEGKFEYG